MSHYLEYLLTEKTLKYSTIKREVKTIRSFLKHNVNIADADEVIRFLNQCSWESGTKDIAIDAYRDYLDMLGLTEIKLQHIRREDKVVVFVIDMFLQSV